MLIVLTQVDMHIKKSRGHKDACRKNTNQKVSRSAFKISLSRMIPFVNKMLRKYCRCCEHAYQTERIHSDEKRKQHPPGRTQNRLLMLLMEEAPPMALYHSRILLSSGWLTETSEAVLISACLLSERCILPGSPES